MCSPPWSLALQPPRCRRPPTCSRLECNPAHLQALCSASLTFGAQMAQSASFEVGASTACASCPHSSWARSFMSRCGSCSAWAILFEPRRWNGQPQTRGRQVGPCGAARSGHGDSVVNDPDSRRLSVTVACERSRVNGTRDHARVHRGRDPPRAPAARSAARCGSARPWRRRLRAAGAAFQAPKPSADPPRRRPGRFPVSRAPGRLMDGPDEDSWSSHDSISVQRGRLMIPTPAACTARVDPHVC